MKYTNKELVEQFKKVWPNGDDEPSWRKVDIEVVLNTENHIRVEVSSMYEAPGLTFSKLMLLSEAFGTKQIDAGDKVNQAGCETCDYNSCYGFIVDIKPEPPSPIVG